MFGLGAYSFLRVLLIRVPPLRRVTFSRRRKSNQKGFTLTFGPRLGSGPFAPGFIRGASPPVCFAAPPLDVFGCAKRSLRSPPAKSLHSACRRALRSKAVLELTLIVLSGEKQGLWAVCCVLPLLFCGSWLASGGGLPDDQRLPVDLNPCGSWLASDGGLTADQALADCRRGSLFGYFSLSRHSGVWKK